MRTTKMMLLTLMGLCATPAMAEDVPNWSGDLAVAYGRNLGQGLNVAEGSFEVKYNVHPMVAVGVRSGGILGVDFSVDEGSASAEAFAGLPLLLKGEGFLGTNPTRPYVGLGAGVTLTNAGGSFAGTDGTNATASAYGVKGPIPTLMPEIGVDITALRLGLQYRWMLGSANSVAASASAGQGGTSASVSDAAPGLSGFTISLGIHLGGPKTS